MVRLLAVQSDEMPAIQRQDRTIERTGECEHVGVVKLLPGFAGLENRQDIVAKPTQPFHHGEWKVLVGVQMGH
jgi:hypothetical protein